MKYLVTGVSAVGKSTLARALQAKGERIIDVDEEPGLAWWRNKQTKEVVDWYPGIGKQWHEEHEWIWDEDKLKKLLHAEADKDVYVIGATHNQKASWHLFDKIFLITVPEDVLKQRLKNRPGEYDFGRTQDEMDIVLQWREPFESELKARGATVIDGDLPTEEIIKRIFEAR